MSVARMIIIIDWMNSIQAHKHDAIIKSRIMTFLIGLLGLRRQRQTSTSRVEMTSSQQQNKELKKYYFLLEIPPFFSFFCNRLSFSLFWHSIFISRICHSSIFHREREERHMMTRDRQSFITQFFFLLLPLPSISNVVVFPPLICCVRFELISTVSFFLLLLLHSFRHSWHFRRQSCITHTTTTSTWQSISIPSKSNDAKAQKSPFRMTRIGN